MAKGSKPSNKGGAKGPYGQPRLTAPNKAGGVHVTPLKGQGPTAKLMPNSGKKVVSKGSPSPTPGKGTKPSSLAKPQGQGKTGMHGTSKGGKK